MEKEKGKVRVIPVIDHWECTDCGSCLEVCPEVFAQNEQTHYIDVRSLLKYPDCVQEAISVCPADCIRWEEQ